MVRPGQREADRDNERKSRMANRRGKNSLSKIDNAAPSLMSSYPNQDGLEKTPIRPLSASGSNHSRSPRAQKNACLKDVLDLILQLLNMHELKFAVTLIERLAREHMSYYSLLDMTTKELSGLLINVTRRQPDSELDFLAQQLDNGFADKPSRFDSSRSPRPRSLSPRPASPNPQQRPPASPRPASPNPQQMSQPKKSIIDRAGSAGRRPPTGNRLTTSPPSRPQSSPQVGSTQANERPPSAQSLTFSRPPSANGLPPPLPPLPVHLREFSNFFTEDSMDIMVEKGGRSRSASPDANVEDITESTAVKHTALRPVTPIKRPITPVNLSNAKENQSAEAPNNGQTEPRERWAHPPKNGMQVVANHGTKVDNDQVKATRFQLEVPKDEPADLLRSSTLSRSSHSLADVQEKHKVAKEKWLDKISRGSLWESKAESVDPIASKQMKARSRPSLINNPKSQAEHEFNTPIACAHNETWWAIPTHRLILSPNGVIRIVWDLLSLLFIIMEAIIVPLNLLFDVATPDPMFYASTGFFGSDLVMNFFTGYYADGILVMKQAHIIWHYLKTWFPLDAASTFPWQLVFSGGNATMLKLAKFGKVMRVVRLLRVAKVGVLLEHVQDLFASPSLIVGLKLSKIVGVIAMICHWVACLWGFLGHPDMHQSEKGQEGAIPLADCEPGGPCEPSIFGSAWRRRYGVEAQAKSEQYLVALRFSTGLFTGNDMGLQPGYWTERLFLIFMFFMSMILGSTVISNIVMIFEGMRQERQEQEELMQSFKQFMAASQVPFQLQSKIKRYLDFQFKSRKELQVRRNELINRLSPWLRKELQKHLNSSVLIQHRFFRDMPSDILAHMCCHAESDISAPGDVIVQCGQNIPAIFFIVKGRLSVSLDETQNLEALRSSSHVAPVEDMPPPQPALRKSSSMSSFDFRPGNGPGEPASQETVLSAPGWIGASSLFKDEVRPYTVISLANSELLKLARDDMDTLMTEFPALDIYIQHYLESCEGDPEGFQDCSLLSIAQVCERTSGPRLST